jgi:hypothetical protein
LAHELVQSLQDGAGGTIRRQPAPGVSAAPGLQASMPELNSSQAPSRPSLAALRPTIAAQHPTLVTLLANDDFVGLEAASSRRYAALDDAAKQQSARPTPESEATAAIAKTSVETPLRTLLTPEALFVDQDIWATFYEVVKAEGSEVTLGELTRNEMMRRYCQRLSISLDAPLTVELLDPDGTAAGPSRLRFRLAGHELGATQGVIAPPDLVAAFGPIDADIASVSSEAETVALGGAIVLELKDVEPIATGMIAGAATNPKSYA